MARPMKSPRRNSERSRVDLASRIRSYIDGEEAMGLLRKYYSGSYTGRRYDELESPNPDRFTAEDIAAVALLSVELRGRAVETLLWTHADVLSDHLKRISHRPLHEVEDDGELEPLWRLQEYFENQITGVGIGHVRRSKLLAHKRPHLVPIRDQHVLRALVDGTTKPLTRPLWQALRADSRIIDRLASLRTAIDRPQLSLIRVLDVIVWMKEGGDVQVPNDPTGE